MEIAVFKNASTFSHPGRHASELKFLLSSLEEKPKKVLEVGSGCIEPIYFAQLLGSEATINAVDLNIKVYNTLTDLVSGKKVKLADLAEFVCNKSNDGKPRRNSDLLNEDRLKINAEELRLAGLNPNDFIRDGYYRMPKEGAKIIPINAELGEYTTQHQNEFDFVYAGVVLLNIGKVVNREGLVDTTKKLVGALKEGKVLGVGTNPAGMYGEKGTPGVLEDSGMATTDLIVDNLVLAKVGGKDRLFGGHCLRAVSVENQNSYSPIAKKTIEQRISEDEILSQAGITHREFNSSNLKGYFSEQGDNLLMVALRRDGGYDLWETPINKLKEVVPKVRYTFGIIPGLKYK